MPPPFHDLFQPRFAPSGGDGAPSLTDVERLRAQQTRKAQALAQNETGVRFESLVLFAEPLFTLYDLDPAEAFALRGHPEEADEAILAVLEAARLLWAYLSLAPAERPARRPALATYLLGPNPTPEDEADLDALFETVEPHWAMLTPQDRALAENVEAETLGFDALLAHPAFRLEDEPAPTERTYGPERLSEMEAQALFAQPLLDEIDNPDELDAAMERAQEYWTLAQLQGLERERYLQELIEALALDAEEAERIRAEAARMTARFHQLFPEA